MKRWDAVVIGGGHNGLVAAAYLGRRGHDVCVLERRHQVGGAAITEEVVPGFRFSRLAYVNSLFRPEIIRELDLARHGFRMLPRSPSSFTPFPDGRSLVLGPDREATCREIAVFSEKDARAWPEYEALLERLVDIVEPTLDECPPDPLSKRPGELVALGKLAWRMRSAGSDVWRLSAMLTGSASHLLDEWFESEALKVTLATDAIIGAMASPSQPGTAYVLFHHVMGETDGVRGVWGYVEGGMGSLSNAIASAAREAGAEIRTDCGVREILVDGTRAVGVVTEDGEEIRARAVLSGVDPKRTFLGLTPEGSLPPEFVSGIEHLDFSSAVFKLNLALSELPNFTARPGSEPSLWHRGTIHICPTLETIEEGYRDALAGRPSTTPILEATIPSVLDSTLAPPGRHVMSLFVQYAPYELAEGSWDDIKESFADRCIEVFEEYAPGFSKSIIARDAISPLDLEREFGLTGGNIFHGAMTPSQLWVQRPLGGWAQYRTPLRGLYLCGSGAHPGGGVLGAPGRNAARVVSKDL